MNIKLIDGHFKAKDAIEIITQMIHVKIKFQEDQIEQLSNEEDIRFRENRIKQLQTEILQVRKLLEFNDDVISLESTIQVSFPGYNR